MADLTVKEAAAELALSESFLYQRAAAAEVPCQRYGRSIRFTSQQVEQIRRQYAQPVVSSRRMRSVAS